MDKIIQKAKELGELLQETEQVKAFLAAKEEYEKDCEVQQLLAQFNLHKITMDQASKSENPDAEKLEELQNRIKDVYDKIMQTEKMKVFQKSGAAIEKIISQVNGILNYYVTGETPNDCADGCDSCGKGCNH